MSEWRGSLRPTAENKSVSSNLQTNCLAQKFNALGWDMRQVVDFLAVVGGIYAIGHCIISVLRCC